MSTQPETRTWFAQSANEIAVEPAPGDSIFPTEFERLWRGFMTARVTLGLVLLLLQGALWGLGQSSNPLLIFICGGYFAAALAARFFAAPQPLGRNFDLQWAFTIGVDVLVFSSLQFLQGGGINYTPLLLLPVLFASVLGSLFLAMGTAAGVSLALLGNSSWLMLHGQGDSPAHFAQSALTGAGCFVIAFLANQLSTRLAQEENRSRLSQLAVQVQREVNELVIESLTDGVLVVDAKGNVRAANPSARLLLGSQRPQGGASFSLNAEPAWAALAEAANQSFTRIDMRSRDVTVHHAGQGMRRLRVRTRLTGGKGSSHQGLCVMFLQDQREMEARMRTEKLASMGRMSAAVAHEIRNPLAAIAQANALLDEDIQDPKQKQLTLMVAQNANRLGKIVDEVLNISRVQARDDAAPAPSLSLNDWADRICHDWSVQTGSTGLMQVSLLAQDIQVSFEPEHLRRVLINLLDNALRYASGERNAIQVWAQLGPGGQGLLEVWSDGPPLEQSVERHLFEPFFSSESRSSGLGLYICRELCEGHGATIVYQRASGSDLRRETQGNRFSITFRTARAGDRQRAARQAPV